MNYTYFGLSEEIERERDKMKRKQPIQPEWTLNCDDVSEIVKIYWYRQTKRMVRMSKQTNMHIPHSTLLFHLHISKEMVKRRKKEEKKTIKTHTNIYILHTHQHNHMPIWNHTTVQRKTERDRKSVKRRNVWKQTHGTLAQTVHTLWSGLYCYYWYG